MKKLMACAAALLGVLMLAAPLCGCAGRAASEDSLTASVTRGEAPSVEPDSHSATAQTAFAAALLRENYKPGENVCLSPLSLYTALAMTQNGAAGDTAAQMNTLLGGDCGTVNGYMRWYADSITDDKQLSSVNSIWTTDDEGMFKPSDAFLQAVADSYSADVFSRPFAEGSDKTVKEINKWVKDGTDGKITELIDEIPVNTVMYLINAASFEAEWEEQYERSDIRDAIFRTADGTEQEIEMMQSSESMYVSDSDATGFIKPYKDGRYSFAAILPNNGVSLDDYIAGLNGEKLAALLASADITDVQAYLPKFTFDYDCEQSEALRALGMTDAFDEKLADFSVMGESKDGLYINRVLHKTFIQVDENGTKAAAVSAIEMTEKCAMPAGHTVYLDRPFMFAIVDNRTGSPVFIGAVNSIK